MQIIQSIRDKGAAIVIVVIALSLIGFILMDAKQGSSRLFSSLSSNVGKVNGETIELNDFNKRVKQAQDMQEQRGGQAPQPNQVREQMWNQVVAEKIFFAEADKLGIEFTSKELSAILLSNDQANPFLQEQGMRDSASGNLDISKAQAALTNIKKLKGDQRESVNAQLVDPLKISTTVAKYSGLLNASAYYPTWMQQRDMADTKNFASISYVNIPYSEIVDSTVKVTDADIDEYVKKHPDMFKQEEGRNISYVSFSELADKEDSTRTSEQVAALKSAFEADTNSKAFIARNASPIEFKDEFVPKSKILSPAADTLSKLTVGEVYGPYIDKNNYVIAKMVGISQLPDSVKARHILIPVENPQSQQPQPGAMPDSTAKKLADSIFNLIKGGEDFATLALKYSSDPGSKIKGGDLGFFGYGMMVPEFNEFSFTKPVGSRDIVRTQFGYHIIEVMNQKDMKPAYKIAYVAKAIEASDVTVNKANLEATKASAEKDAASLTKYAAKNNLRIMPVPALVKENDFAVNGLEGDARLLVRWIFDAKKGDVSEVFNFDNQFIVATLDKINKKGVQDAAVARSGSESIIRNKKKSEIIIKKIGSNPTLESAASAYNKQVQQAGADSSVTFSSQLINGVGVEPKVIGATFRKDYQTKVSPPIDGTSGVYLIKVNAVQSKAADTPETIAQQATAKLTNLRSQLNSWYEALRKQADIKDNRSKHF